MVLASRLWRCILLDSELSTATTIMEPDSFATGGASHDKNALKHKEFGFQRI